MMNPVPWLQMTNMISYQGLVRTFPSFSPQSGFWPGQNQVFKSDDTAAGAAKNVGVVVFSEKYKKNVLNNDGTSKITYDVSGQDTAFLTDYQFYARYQNIGVVAGGVVTSKVLVDVTYE